jgi:hypothetical protein
MALMAEHDLIATVCCVHAPVEDRIEDPAIEFGGASWILALTKGCRHNVIFVLAVLTVK